MNVDLKEGDEVIISTTLDFQNLVLFRRAAPIISIHIYIHTHIYLYTHTYIWCLCTHTHTHIHTFLSDYRACVFVVPMHGSSIWMETNSWVIYSFVYEMLSVYGVLLLYVGMSDEPLPCPCSSGTPGRMWTDAEHTLPNYLWNNRPLGSGGHWLIVWPCLVVIEWICSSFLILWI